ncbi:hypothetical protein ACFVXG_00785 [Kitasatospora sp. NPDC058162]|uniref:effector-associated constant component EACC1 n=1 Tax=Kitasatospora sp. NPDC058162 TaxID=3346362 RepID=UPI0036DDD0AC
MDDLARIRIDGTGSTDELRSLRQWLIEEDRLRGRVQLAEAPPEPGTLGSVLDTLTVALGPGGVATAVASVLISWIRRQRGNVSVKVTRPDGTVAELSATHVSALEAPEVRQLAAELARSLDQGTVQGNGNGNGNGNGQGDGHGSPQAAAERTAPGVEDGQAAR